jgi:L-iditol 2-dehydrogenase
MKAIVVDQIGSFDLRDVAEPVPGPGEVKVRVAVAGLCRTDLKLIESGHRDLILPRIPAEEVVGVVSDVGSDTDSNWLGKRVYLYPGTWCGVCPACRKGAENLCARMRIMGFHRDGGFAEAVISPVRSLLEIPDSLAFEEAVLTEPLSCALNGLELARLTAGEVLFIWGAGPAGTLLSRAACARGVKTVLIEPDPERRRQARALAVPPEGECDAAVVAVGSPEAYAQSLLSLGMRGRLVLFSGLAARDAAFPVDFNRLHYREQTLTGAYGCSFRHGVDALNLIASGAVVVSDLVTHRFPLEQLGDALDLVRTRRSMKILMLPHMKGLPHD